MKSSIKIEMKSPVMRLRHCNNCLPHLNDVLLIYKYYVYKYIIIYFINRRIFHHFYCTHAVNLVYDLCLMI